ncbi:hypothetical protein AVEN_130615-1 [Araneus ventricosus]|uniref:RNase H type-1 domain-containing protein n=1 Tax=Araneus ventricosus TaxID=182803 RepID=A0A4Y2RS01_ARAVE|nr:hypothetical protein AVEN_130615-1 [Araneus ventricosus]
MEFQSCLASVQDSSPGPDSITYSMIKHLTTESQDALLNFYNHIWQEQCFPTQWQQAIIIPLLKPGKDPKNPSNYRPIALTCCLCKILERMINRRLVYYLETNLSPHPRVGSERVGAPLTTCLLLKQTFDSHFYKESIWSQSFLTLKRLTTGPGVFTAETAAVLLALEKISDCLERKFIIYTDSLSVLESLKSFYMHSHHHPLVLNVLNLLNKLASRDFNILCWVPSHVGIVVNEKADKAAKLATAPTNSSTSLTDFKKYTKLLFYTKWQRRWDTETENKLHAVKPHLQLWSSLMNRKADTLLARLRVGYTRYTHRHLLFGEQAPMCSQCNCSMSVQHILSECPNFNSRRLHFFRTSSVNLSLLLGEAPHVNLFAFLRSIGFYPHI